MSARISVGRLSSVGGRPLAGEERSRARRLKARVTVPQMETVKSFEDPINEWALRVVKTTVEQAARRSCTHSRFSLGGAGVEKRRRMRQRKREGKKDDFSTVQLYHGRGI